LAHEMVHVRQAITDGIMDEIEAETLAYRMNNISDKP